MKRFLMPPWLTRIAWALGLICMGLRFWLLETGLDDRGLLVRSHPGNLLSWMLALIMVLVLALSFWLKQPVRMVPSTKVAAGTVFSALGFLVAGWTLLEKRYEPLHMPAAVVAAAAILCSVWMLVCLCRKVRVHPLTYAPGVLFFVMFLVCRYQNWNSEPEPQYCVFHILALVGLTLTAYVRGTLAKSRKNWKGYLQLSRWCVFWALAAVPGCVDALPLILWAVALSLDGCTPRKSV